MADDAAAARFLALNGAKLPPRPEREGDKRGNKIRGKVTRRTEMKRGPGPKAKTRIKQVSEKQSILNKRWSFIRACFLKCQKKTDGYYSCMECGMKYTNARQLQLHHIDRRGQGGDYTIDNAMLVGSGPGTCQCHERLDGNLVKWSNG